VSRRLLAAAEAPPAPQASADVATWRAGRSHWWRFSSCRSARPDSTLRSARLAAGSAARAASCRARGDQSFDSLVAQVETHLDSQSEDGRGWEVIAPIYLRLGRFDDAVKARRQALRSTAIHPNANRRWERRLVFAANGM
jgi:Cytochrome c biogenesis factor